MDVIIVGENPLVDELEQIFQGSSHGVDTFKSEEVLSTRGIHILKTLGDKTDVIIEAHDKSAESKQLLLQRLDVALPEVPLLLVSALSTSATEAAAWTQKPGRVAGYGLISPFDQDRVVEIAAALQTEDQTISGAEKFWRVSGFDPVQVADGPALVRARILCCLINEAISALMEGVADAEDIDRAMRLGTNYPQGPLSWADHLGLDIVYAVMTGLYREWGEERYRPSPLLRRKVVAGQLGKKTGRGFYEYEVR